MGGESYEAPDSVIRTGMGSSTVNAKGWAALPAPIPGCGCLLILLLVLRRRDERLDELRSLAGA